LAEMADEEFLLWKFSLKFFHVTLFSTLNLSYSLIFHRFNSIFIF